jgi:hypothetical protein
VTRERDYVVGLAQRHGLEDRSPPHATGPAVTALLNEQDSQIDLWHFAGHGDVSQIELADGGCVRPEDLYGPRQTTISRSRPLVFLNACRVGQQSWSLTQLARRMGRSLGRTLPLWRVHRPPLGGHRQTRLDLCPHPLRPPRRRTHPWPSHPRRPHPHTALCPPRPHLAGLQHLRTPQRPHKFHHPQASPRKQLLNPCAQRPAVNSSTRARLAEPSIRTTRS